MVAGSVLHFVVTESVNSPVSLPGPLLRLRRRKTYAEQPLSLIIIIIVIISLVVAALIFLAPLTYGKPGLLPAGVNRRKLLHTW